MVPFESRKSKVESRKSKVESRKSKVESRKLKVESRKSKVESRKKRCYTHFCDVKVDTTLRFPGFYPPIYVHEYQQIRTITNAASHRKTRYRLHEKALRLCTAQHCTALHCIALHLIADTIFVKIWALRQSRKMAVLRSNHELIYTPTLLHEIHFAMN
jgi:hypothetical protein